MCFLCSAGRPTRGREIKAESGLGGGGSGVSPGSLLTGLTFIERINWLHSLQDKDTNVIAVAVSRADHQCSQQSPANRHFITD